MEDKDVLHQADALIKRWRAPASSPAPEPSPAEEPVAAESDEDIPLLTEAVSEEPPLPTLTETYDPHAAQRLALREELDQWLDHALPDAVLRVLDGLADQLIGQLGQQARQDLLPRLEAALRSQPTPMIASQGPKDPD